MHMSKLIKLCVNETHAGFRNAVISQQNNFKKETVLRIFHFPKTTATKAKSTARILVCRTHQWEGLCKAGIETD